MRHHNAGSDDMIQRIASAGTALGGGTAVAGGVSAETILAIGGFSIALLSFFINWYYQHRRMKILLEQHDRQRNQPHNRRATDKAAQGQRDEV